ncbi:MAG: aldose epimerase family protein [Verrucomicrobiales bacterium]
MLEVTRAPFGVRPDGREVEIFTLRHGDYAAEILNQGAILRSWIWPGNLDVVLGCESLDDYWNDAGYHGAVVGRYGNRIAAGKFTLDGETFQLPINNGPNHLHGGSPGFDKAPWESQITSEGLLLSLVSPDGEQGYPGELHLQVLLSLGADGALRYDCRAEVFGRATILNPTAHAYFNLAGHDAGAFETDHELQILASAYVPKNGDGIPLGHIAPVADTAYDFRKLRTMREPDGHDELATLCGYDHTWVIDGEAGKLRSAALVRHQSGRALEVLTTEPGIHFYNGHFNGHSPALMKGTGNPSTARSGFALETQHFPDSPNQPAFPTVVLRPGEIFRSTTVYRPMR